MQGSALLCDLCATAVKNETPTADSRVNASVIGWPVKKSTFAQFHSVHFCSDHYISLSDPWSKRKVNFEISV